MRQHAKVFCNPDDQEEVGVRESRYAKGFECVNLIPNEEDDPTSHAPVAMSNKERFALRQNAPAPWTGRTHDVDRLFAKTARDKGSARPFDRPRHHREDHSESEIQVNGSTKAVHM